MKRVVFVFCCVIFLGVASPGAYAAKRMLMYVEQDAPGKLVWCTLIEARKKIYGTYTDFRGPNIGERIEFVIEKSQFEDIWSILSNPELEQYIFVPSKEDNMSDVGFYTIEATLKGKKRNFRIPSSAEEDNAQKFIQKMKSLINP